MWEEQAFYHTIFVPKQLVYAESTFPRPKSKAIAWCFCSSSKTLIVPLFRMSHFDLNHQEWSVVIVQEFLFRQSILKYFFCFLSADGLHFARSFSAELHILFIKNNYLRCFCKRRLDVETYLLIKRLTCTLRTKVLTSLKIQNLFSQNTFSKASILSRPLRWHDVVTGVY